MFGVFEEIKPWALFLVFMIGIVIGFFFGAEPANPPKPRHKVVYTNTWTYLETPILEYEIIDEWRFYIVTTNKEKQFYYFPGKAQGGEVWFEDITN